MNSQNILIVTGIFPPRVGGPSQYAKEIDDEFKRMGHKTFVRTFSIERILPSGFRHLFFFLRILFVVPWADLVIALDTFSVGWPAVCAARIFRKKIIIRTGGDFLWEMYVERTGDLVRLSRFYFEKKANFNSKEKIIFKLTRWTLKNASAIIFSTNWQKDIFTTAYGLDRGKNFIVENFYGDKLESFEPKKKIFVAGTRKLKWKNLERLVEAFNMAKKDDPEIELDLSNAPYQKFLDKMAHSYAVVLVSMGDISPNMILDSIKLNKPFILTEENGLIDRISDISVLVRPESVEDIKNKILFIAQKENYNLYKSKIEQFHFRHSWHDICQEFVSISEKIK